MKRILFAAAMATIAIGGAYSTYASGVYYDASNNRIDCTGQGALCNEMPPQTLWTEEGPSGETINSQDLPPSAKFQ